MDGWLPEIDPLSAVFVAAFTTVGLPSLLYLASLSRDLRRVAAASAFVISALGVVLAQNLLTFLICWELTVLWACGMLLEDRQAGSLTVLYRYFLMQVMAGTSLFLGIAIQYASNGSFAMEPLVPAAFPFFGLAFLTKAAVIPLHIWVPLTYPYIHPASAVVLSACTTKIGVYGLARFLPGTPGLATLGAVMALFGVLMALRQKTARQLLSYLLLSQIGYMLIGIGLGSPAGLDGATLHVWNHVVYKSLLFMVAGAMVYRTGSEAFSRAGNWARWMPFTFLAAVVGAAASAGLPPLNAYVSKNLLKKAAEGDRWLENAMLVAAVLTTFCLCRLLHRLFLQPSSSSASELKTVRPLPIVAGGAMAVLACLCLAQGLLYPRITGMPFPSISPEVFARKDLLAGALPVALGLGGYLLACLGVWRAPLRKPSEPTAAQLPAAGTALPNANPADNRLPWDLDLPIAWLSRQVQTLSRVFAACARDRTQEYILMITAMLVVLVLFLCWW